MPDHTPLTDAELAAMRERLRRVLEENLNPLTIVYEDSPRCLDEIDALREKLRQAIGLLEDAANWEGVGPLEIETQKEIAAFCKGLRSTLSPAEPEGDVR